MPEMHELLPMVMSGDLTPEEAGDAFRKDYLDFCRRNNIDPNKRNVILDIPKVSG